MGSPRSGSRHVVRSDATPRVSITRPAARQRTPASARTSSRLQAPSSTAAGGAVRRSCLSPQGEFCAGRLTRAAQGSRPQADRRKSGRLLCPLSWRSKKVGRPPGRTPGQRSVKPAPRVPAAEGPRPARTVVPNPPPPSGLRLRGAGSCVACGAGSKGFAYRRPWIEHPANVTPNPRYPFMKRDAAERHVRLPSPDQAPPRKMAPPPIKTPHQISPPHFEAEKSPKQI